MSGTDLAELERGVIALAKHYDWKGLVEQGDVDVLALVKTALCSQLRAEGRLGPDSEATVICLRRMIERAVDGLPQEEADASRAYWFLDEPSPPMRRFEKRRERAGAAMNAAFRGAPEGRLRALVAGSVALLEQEAKRDIPEPAPPHTPQPPVSSLTNRIAATLQPAYGSAPSLTALASNVAPHKEPWTYTTIAVTLADTAYDRTEYSFSLSISFTSNIREYVLALVWRRSHCDTILSACSRVSEVLVLQSTEQMEEAAQEIASGGGNLTFFTTGEDGRRSNRKASFARVSDQAASDYLENFYTDYSTADVIVLRAEVANGAAIGPARARLKYETTLTRDHQFCYWLTDRPTHVSSLTIDTAHFTDGHGNRPESIRLHTFLPNAGAPLRLDDGGRLEEDLDLWMTYGHGVGIAW